MANGNNEPLHFTRNDAERLKAIEILQTSAEKKLTHLCNTIHQFMNNHKDTTKQVVLNTNFRKTTKKVLLWFFTSSIFIGVLVSIARSMGWLV